MKLKLFSTKNETGDYYSAKYRIYGKEKIEKLGYFTSENAAKRFVVEWIGDTINNLNEINFDYWQYISLCLQDKRITI